MTRTGLPLPAGFAFATEMEVRVSDVNYGGHLGNDALLALLQEARLRFLATKGFGETDAGGAALILVEAHVQYRRQARRGDRLRVEVALPELGRAGFDLAYRVTRPADGAEIAVARTALAFYDYAREKVCRMPAAFRAAFGGAPSRL